MDGIKGDGLKSETGGMVASVGKGTKTVVSEVGEFLKTGERQILGKKPPAIKIDGEKQREVEKKKIEQIRAALRKMAEWEKRERERILQERKRLAQIREEALKKKEKEPSFWDPVAWFKKIGKKMRGWIFERRKREIKPAGFRG